jgi:hypothetical protein
MSISAVSGAAQAYQKPTQPPAASPAPAATPFGQQLNDVQAPQTPTAQGHHHHHHGGGGSQSAATSAAGASPSAGSTASALLNLLT